MDSAAKWDEIREFAERYRLFIEDTAQAIGAGIRGQRCIEQAARWASRDVSSFYPSKNLGAAGGAGLIIANDEQFAQPLRIFRQHGMEQQYFHRVIGGNFVYEIQAAILSVKLPYLESWSASRRRGADVYREEFTRAGLTATVAIPVELYRSAGVKNHHIYHQYVIRSPRRDELREYVRKREIGTVVYYPLGLHRQQCFSHLGYKRGDLPETELARAETLALPILPGALRRSPALRLRASSTLLHA